MRASLNNRRLTRYILLVALAVIAIWAGRFSSDTSLAQSSPRVDLALVLAIDCSFSVNAKEFDLQMRGLANALSSEEVISAIENGPYGGIAITVVEWAGARDQKIVVPWKIIRNAQSVTQVANEIATAPRLALGKTSISAAIDFSVLQLSLLPARATRRVIDISADGVNNDGNLPQDARQRALDAGIIINGLTIINEVEGLDSYFERYIIGGPGRFVFVANDYQRFEEAMKEKLLKEIKGTPVS